MTDALPAAAGLLALLLAPAGHAGVVIVAARAMVEDVARRIANALLTNGAQRAGNGR